MQVVVWVKRWDWDSAEGVFVVVSVCVTRLSECALKAVGTDDGGQVLRFGLRGEVDVVEGVIDDDVTWHGCAKEVIAALRVNDPDRRL